MLYLVDDTPLKVEKEKCSILFLANKYFWILFVIYGEYFFNISHLQWKNGHGCWISGGEKFHFY